MRRERLRGSGQPFVSWTHIEGALGVIAHAIRDAKLAGPVNAVAPEAMGAQAVGRNGDHAGRRAVRVAGQAAHLAP